MAQIATDGKVTSPPPPAQPAMPQAWIAPGMPGWNPAAPQGPAGSGLGGGPFSRPY